MSRSQRARLWVRWAWRDARRHWPQVVSIAVLLALGVGMYAALSSMSAWRVDSADESFATLGMHDLRVALPEGSTVAQWKLSGALERSGAAGAVVAASERLVVPTQVDASVGGRSIIVPGRLVGMRPGTAVDRLDRRAGRLPAGGAVALEHNFARHYDLPAAGRLTLAGGRRVTYSGQVLAPEYFIVTAPGADFGAEAAFAVVFAPLRTAQALTGRRGQVNELVLRVHPGADVAAVGQALTRRLRAELPRVGATVTAKASEPAHRMIYKDAEGDQQMFDIFAFLLLGAAAFAAFNLVSRTVEAQRREIGIGMALGVEPRSLARRPLLLGGQVALLGVVLGVPVGLAADMWLEGVMADFFPLPVITAEFQPGPYLEAALLGILLPLVATALPVRRALRVTPVEAIRVGARSARSGGLAWLLRGVRIPGGTLANLPVRNVLRTPPRTILTMLGIGAVVSIIIALSGMIDSFDRTLAVARTEALAGARDRLTVDLAVPAPGDDPVVRRVSGAASVGDAEATVRVAATLIAGRHRIGALLEGVPAQPRLWHPSYDEGTLDQDGPGLVIARRAADDLGLAIGDRVVVRHPMPTGPRTSRLADTPLRVAAIHTSPFRFVAYANAPAIADMGLGGLVSRISVVPARGHGAADVKAELLALPAVGAVQGASAMTDAVDDRLAQFTDVLLVTVAIAAAMAFLIALNASAINADERRREHATMFAYGVSVGRVIRGTVAEALIVGALGTAVGVLAGRVLLWLVITTTMPETMPDVGALIAVSPGTYALAIVAGTAIVAAAPVLGLRRLRRADIPSTLRVVE